MRGWRLAGQWSFGSSWRITFRRHSSTWDFPPRHALCCIMIWSGPWDFPFQFWDGGNEFEKIAVDPADLSGREWLFRTLEKQESLGTGAFIDHRNKLSRDRGHRRE